MCIVSKSRHYSTVTFASVARNHFIKELSSLKGAARVLSHLGDNISMLKLFLRSVSIHLKGYEYTVDPRYLDFDYLE